MPLDDHYWWGGKVGVIVGIEDDHYQHWPTLRVLLAAEKACVGYAKFGANFVELISEAK